MKEIKKLDTKTLVNNTKDNISRLLDSMEKKFLFFMVLALVLLIILSMIIK